MKKKISGLIVAGFLVSTLSGQTDFPPGYRNFPLVFTLQFHSLSLPFQHIKSNFSNVGFGVGTELSFGKRSNWVQQVQVLWYRNRTVGNGLLGYTQTAWRPRIGSGLEPELKIGAGYLLSFRPVSSYKPVAGKWEPVGHRGKGMLVLPVGAAVGYARYSSNTYLAPFVGYQFLLVKGYSLSVPVVPETLLQLGARIHLQDQ